MANYLDEFRPSPTVVVTLLLSLFTLPSAPVYACGWWGDGEMNYNDDAIVIGPEGKPIPDFDAWSEAAFLRATRLPGKRGYGIAISNQGRAVPYLHATYGRVINRIDEFKSLGFASVIDLGAYHKAARLHRAETEGVGMRYFNISVKGVAPSEEQVKRFNRMVSNVQQGPWLVYAPTAGLLGTMWAAHRIMRGAPWVRAVGEGRALGMMPEQEMALLETIGGISSNPVEPEPNTNWPRPLKHGPGNE